MKKILWIIMVIVMVIGLAGCGIFKNSEGPKDDQEINYKKLEYTLPEEDEIPEKLQEEIESNKQQPFTLTYSDDKDLYIVVGYGEKSTGGYSIKVLTVGKANEKIHVITELIEPNKEDVVTTVLTYPYVVIKTKDLGLPVEFKALK